MTIALRSADVSCALGARKLAVKKNNKQLICLLVSKKKAAVCYFFSFMASFLIKSASYLKNVMYIFQISISLTRIISHWKKSLSKLPFRQYGDHLYNKGDNAAAIENYIKTIGTLEPSYVIRRFLDAHKIHFLTAYLQALHKEGLANEDHTTLLLNCYTKLKDKSKLDEFIFKGNVPMTTSFIFS